MAPQESIPVSANILGTIGTICWCVQLVPQIWRNYRTKCTEGLPASMMLIWSISGVPFGVYTIAQKFNIPLIIQPQCFCILCGVSWAQCLIYGRKWSVKSATLFLCLLLVVFGGIEAALVIVVSHAYSKGIDWPVLVIGIVAFVTLISGYLPIPFELLKRRGRVQGIDFIFLTIDWCGAFFSLMALVAQTEFDTLFGTMYALCCAIEMSMTVSHLIWLVRTRGLRRRAEEAGKAFDDYEEARRWQSKGFDCERKLQELCASLLRKRFDGSTTDEVHGNAGGVHTGNIVKKAVPNATT